MLMRQDALSWPLIIESYARPRTSTKFGIVLYVCEYWYPKLVILYKWRKWAKLQKRVVCNLYTRTLLKTMKLVANFLIFLSFVAWANAAKW